MMPAKTVDIAAADLRPGHILVAHGRPARIEVALPDAFKEKMIVEQVGGKPRLASFQAYGMDTRLDVTARSAAYVQSHEHALDMKAAQGILASNKELLRTQAAELARGEAIDLRPFAAQLVQQGQTQDAALLRRLPGLRVQIDAGKGLVVTDRPAGYTDGPAETWNNLQIEARSRKLLAFVAAQAPSGVMDIRFRSALSGEDVGLLSRVDLKTGAARTARAGDIEAAAPTLDTARQRAEMGDGLKQIARLTHENGLLRPDLPHVSPARRSQLTLIEERRAVSGQFTGISASGNPDRMLIHLARDGGEDRVSVPRDAISRIPENLAPGTPVKIDYAAARGLRVHTGRDRSTGPGLELTR